MRAHAGAVTVVVGADVAVIGTRGRGGREAIVHCLVASSVALAAGGAWITTVHATRPACASVRAVAEDAIVARGIVVRVHTPAVAIAVVVGAYVAVVTAWRAGCGKAAI